MPQKSETRYPTVAARGRVDATKDRNEISNRSRREGGWMPHSARVSENATKDRKSNSGRGREGGCHKRLK